MAHIKSIEADHETGPGYALIEVDGDLRAGSVALAFFNDDNNGFLWPSRPDHIVWRNEAHYFQTTKVTDLPARFRLGPEICNFLEADSAIEISSRDGELSGEKKVWPGVPTLASYQGEVEAKPPPSPEKPPSPDKPHLHDDGAPSGLRSPLDKPYEIPPKPLSEPDVQGGPDQPPLLIDQKTSDQLTKETAVRETPPPADADRSEDGPSTSTSNKLAATQRSAAPGSRRPIIMVVASLCIIACMIALFLFLAHINTKSDAISYPAIPRADRDRAMKAAEDSSKSVFKLETVSIYQGTLSKHRAQSWDKDDGPLDKASKAICRRTSYSVCLEFSGAIDATAFVFLQPNVLLTSLHTFQDYLRSYWGRVSDAITDIPIPLLLYADNNETLIFGKGNDFATLNRLPADAKTKILNGTFDENASEDFVLVSLSRSVGIPLQPSQRSSASLNVVGINGFDTAHYGNRYFAIGGIITTVPCHGFDSASEQMIIHSSYESSNGSSGAPVLDQYGQVAGLHAGGCNVVTGISDTSFFIPMEWIMQNINSVR